MIGYEVRGLMLSIHFDRGPGCGLSLVAELFAYDAEQPGSEVQSVEVLPARIDVLLRDEDGTRTYAALLHSVFGAQPIAVERRAAVKERESP